MRQRGTGLLEERLLGHLISNIGPEGFVKSHGHLPDRTGSVVGTTSPSNLRRVDFHGCGPLQPTS